MRSCVYCKTKYEKDSGVSFHKFPSDYLLKQWLKKMKLDNWTPKASDYLCSKHFTDRCFIIHGSRTALKKCSVPTIFLKTDSSLIAARDDLSTDDDDDQGSQDCEMNITESRSPLVPLKVELSNDDCQYREMNQKENVPSKALGRIITTAGTCTSYDTSNSSTSDNASQSGAPKRTLAEICASVKLDHHYENSSKSSKLEFERVSQALRKSQTQVKVLSQKVKRLEIRISALKTVIAPFRRTVPETQNTFYADDQNHISRITRHADDLIRILPDLVSQIT